MFYRKHRSISNKYFKYETIPLKLYLEITESREVLRICREGVADVAECESKWEEIVRKNNEANGNFEMDIYFGGIRDYALLQNEYILVRSALTKLCFDVDYDLIKELRERGYKIRTDGKTQEERNANYAESLYNALRRSNNIVTKTNVKASELAEILKKNESKRSSFDSIMANLCFHWPNANVNDYITLARYNEYMKLIKEKYRKQKKNGSRTE